MNTCLLLLFLIWTSVSVDIGGLDSDDCKAFPPQHDCGNDDSDNSTDKDDSSGDDNNNEQDNEQDIEQNNENTDQGKSDDNKNGNNIDTGKNMDADKKGSGLCKDENDTAGSKLELFHKNCSEVLSGLTNKTKLPNQIGIAITACLSLPTIWMSRNIALFYKDKAKTQVYLFKFNQLHQDLYQLVQHLS